MPWKTLLAAVSGEPDVAIGTPDRLPRGQESQPEKADHRAAEAQGCRATTARRTREASRTKDTGRDFDDRHAGHDPEMEPAAHRKKARWQCLTTPYRTPTDSRGDSRAGAPLNTGESFLGLHTHSRRPGEHRPQAQPLHGRQRSQGRWFEAVAETPDRNVLA